MTRLRKTVMLLASTTMLASGLVGLGAVPASAACDMISVAKPTKSGDFVRANSSVCAAKNWRGRSWIERDRGAYWDEVNGGNVRGIGINKTKQYPRAWKCKGAGTYTYRGRIWVSNGVLTHNETSAKNRFKC